MISATNDLEAEVAILRGEVAYLRRALSMIRAVLPYQAAKSGGCAHARRLIHEAIDTSEQRLKL